MPALSIPLQYMVRGTGDLSLHRTFLAHERTLMAGGRTSTSMMSFGFTISNFFQYLVQTNIGVSPRGGWSPSRFAMCMIGVGIAALRLACIDHRKLTVLEQEHDQKYRSLAGTMSSLICSMSIGLRVVVLLHG